MPPRSRGAAAAVTALLLLFAAVNAFTESTDTGIPFVPGNIWNGVYLNDPPSHVIQDGDMVHVNLSFTAHWVTGNWQGTSKNLTFPVTGRRYDMTTPGRTLRVKRGTTFEIVVHNGLWGATGPNTIDVTCEEADGISYSCMNHTNLHLHGLVVDPRGVHGDNVFIDIPPGENHVYRYTIPDDHPQGTFWYHPHWHGSTALQVASGVFGAFVVEDDKSDYGGAAHADARRFIDFPESIFMLSYHYYQLHEYSHLLESKGLSTWEVDNYNHEIDAIFNYTGTPWVSLTNGQYRPGVEIVEKTYYRWRLVMAPVIFVNVTFFPLWDFGAECNVWAVARDGVYFAVRDVLLGNAPELFSSGARLDVVVYCDEVPENNEYLEDIGAHSKFDEEDYLNAFFLPVFKKCPDGVCDSSDPWDGGLPHRPKYMRDAELFDYSQLAPRRITWDFDYRPGPNEPHYPNYWWSINKVWFDTSKTLPDWETGEPTPPTRFGDFELWRLETWENLGHVFHLHTNHFMLVDFFIANPHDIELGRSWDQLLGRWMDNIMTPLGDDMCHTGVEDQNHDVVTDAALVDNSTCTPGWVEILVHFTKFPGRRVLHCHFLNHEDHGMMNWMQVCDPDEADETNEEFCSELTTEEAEESSRALPTWAIVVIVSACVLAGAFLTMVLFLPFCCKPKPELQYMSVQ